MKRTAGLTIVELLIGVAILGIIIMAVSLPLTTFLGMNRKSSLTLGATSDAQDAMEQARRIVLANFPDPQPLLNTQTWPANITVACADVNAQGTVTNATCQAAIASGTPAVVMTASIAMRRLTVTATVNGVQETRLNLDVRP